MGAVLTGRGVIQIWCFLTIYVKDAPSQGNKKARPNSKEKRTATYKEPSVTKRPRGRPRKEPPTDIVERVDIGNEHVQPLAVEYPIGSPRLDHSEGTSGNATRHEDCARIDKDSDSIQGPNPLLLTGPKSCRNKEKAAQGNVIHNNSLHFLRECQHAQSPRLDPLIPANCSLDSMSSYNDTTSLSSMNSILDDVALPRMMLCLAHNGKVAWDVKWRPVSACYPVSRNIMGYLAVLLGSGALEV